MQKKDGRRVRSTIRMSPDEIAQADKAMHDLGLGSRNEYFLMLHRKHLRQREDLEKQLSTVVERLDQQIGRRMQQINTASQLTVAMLTTFMKYAVSVLPPVPEELKAAATAQGRLQYEKIERFAMREFRAARLEKRFDGEDLSLTGPEGPSDTIRARSELAEEV